MAEDHAPNWEETTSCSAFVISALRRPVGEIVAIVATVDVDGSPRTAAFGSVGPITGRELRFGCNRRHGSSANVVRDGQVMVALFASPDIAVGIRGRAQPCRSNRRKMCGARRAAPPQSRAARI